MYTPFFPFDDHLTPRKNLSIRRFRHESITDSANGQLVGIYEALNSGVTSILEHAHATFSNATSAAYLNASMDSAVRMWWCYAFHELSNGFSIKDQIANFRDLNQNERLVSSLVEMGMAYDAFASASSDEIQSIIDLAKYVIAAKGIFPGLRILSS